MAEKPQKQKQGWGNPRPYNANSKFHYFKNGIALCGKWMQMPFLELEEGMDDHRDNCAQCKKLKAKLIPSAPAAESHPETTVEPQPEFHPESQE